MYVAPTFGGFLLLALPATFDAGAGTSLISWYLFDKGNVVEYYRSLERMEAAADARRASDSDVGA